MVDNRRRAKWEYSTAPNLSAEPQSRRKKRKAFLLENATEKTREPGPFLYLAIRRRIDGQVIKPTGPGSKTRAPEEISSETKRVGVRTMRGNKELTEKGRTSRGSDGRMLYAEPQTYDVELKGERAREREDCCCPGLCTREALHDRQTTAAQRTSKKSLIPTTDRPPTDKWRRGARGESGTGLGRINMEWIIDWRSPRKELI